MTRALPLSLAAVLLSGVAAMSSVPGEDHGDGTDAAGIAAPINLAEPRQTPAAAMTYEIFEATVEHGDMPECPAAMAQEGRFCRVVLQNDMLHVFAFAEDGDQPMIAVMEYPLDAVTFPQ
ncbi:hypothetical protein H5395_15130 [Paracoccus sp. MC1854]|uniref:hypothetical protein n=1 Tax=Paracoccus sp. MC1854 TaxID=2760306 RepID=UPI00160357B5|nr:hypothetical protein [Paracoccus sp. MC1854]MBB1492836.1 hypothetical protein [Paracoccus sp. MC1854]